jgi:hypothetical protein
MSWKNIIQKTLSSRYNTKVEIDKITGLSGGSINDTMLVSTNSGKFFVKRNSASKYPGMFEKEAKGLNILSGKSTLKVPAVIALGASENVAFLILDYVDSGSKGPGFWDQFAKGLAQLHKNSADRFGLDHDNYIGSLYQSNKMYNSWTEFFQAERLEKQLKLARDHGKIGSSGVRSFDNFFHELPNIFPAEPPSLLHGDLWGGNYMVDNSGNAVLIDPAVYFGHREMDIGMTQLFGGFSNEFYDAYNNYYPLEKGWQERLDYCNLYPLMVHVNLFGGGYLNAVQSILKNF